MTQAEVDKADPHDVAAVRLVGPVGGGGVEQPGGGGHRPGVRVPAVEQQPGARGRARELRQQEQWRGQGYLPQASRTLENRPPRP